MKSRTRPADQGNTACDPGPAPTTPPCCAPGGDQGPENKGLDNDRPGQQRWRFVCGWRETPLGRIPQVTTKLTATDIFGRWQMRWGLGRMRYRITPGIYAIGAPTASSPVLVTANYKMTFDFLRRDLHSHDVWVLVLETKGINVWCAAGKGTFGTEEIIRRVQTTRLEQLIDHRTLILPQLGAPGTQAHRITRATGFQIIFGPVLSADLPRFLSDGCKATPQMRQVPFTIIDRLVLTPVELVNLRKQFLWSVLVLLLLGGIGNQGFSLAAAWQRGGAAILTMATAAITGAVLVPVLLPWLPGRAFAVKGAVAGLAVGLLGIMTFPATLDGLNRFALLMATTAIASWCAMHFTGSSTFTSPSGVAREMRRAIPAQAALLLASVLCWLATAFS
ncbi:MAG: mercury methylation corrinoid protein HgcA [Desulfuromonadales bacterium]